MQLNRLAFNQLRLKCLNTETVQRRRTVEHHRVLEDHFFEDVPDDVFLILDHLLGCFRRRRQTATHKLIEDEGLEQFKRHQLGQAALVQAELRTDRNNGTAGIVDALAEQILAEAAALALDHIGERLERTLVRARHGLAASTVVQQRINSLLQHALFVAHDDVRRLDFKKALQAVVAVDDAAVEIVEVRSRKTAAVERYERTKVGRQHRQDGHDHPFGLNAGALEAFQNLEALGVLLDLRFRTRAVELFTQTSHLAVDVDRAQEFADRFGPHHCLEVIAEFSRVLNEFVFGEQLAALERGEARIDDDVGFKIEHSLDVAKRNVEHHAHTARQALQEPNVRHGTRKVNMPHAFAANLGKRHFNAALFADNAAVLEALVLAAKAFVVLHRPENLGAEEPVALRLLSTVIDRFRLLDFAVRPGMDLLRTRKTNADRVEVIVLLNLIENIVKRRIHRLSPLNSSRVRCRCQATGFL